MCDQLVHKSLTDGEVTRMFLESQLSVCWLHLILGLCAGCQHAVNFYLVGNVLSAKQLSDMAHYIIYRP